MNKLIKAILYIVAGCAGVGCAALVLGLVLGKVSPGYREEGVQWFRERVHGIAELADGQVRRHGTVQDEDADTAEATWDVGAFEGASTYVLDEVQVIEEDRGYDTQGRLSVSGDQVDCLDIKLRHGGLEIVETDSDQIYVGLLEDNDAIDITCEGDQVTIRDDRNGSAAREDLYIYMKIPQGKQFEDVQIEINAGTLNIAGRLDAEQMDLKTDAGQISASALKSEDFTAKVGAGSIDIQECDFEEVKLDCGLGIIDLYQAAIHADAEVTCGMGTVEMELTGGKLDAMNYVLNCGLGTIQLQDQAYSSLSHEKRIDNGASSTIQLDCGMGTISVWES